MYYPLVGERVRVSGCGDEFIVARTDYSARLAAITPVAGTTTMQQNVPFGLLSGDRDFETPQRDGGVLLAAESVLRSSRMCVHQARVLMRELRETMRLTLVSIRRSQTMISESDEVIARWQTLGCKRD